MFNAEEFCTEYSIGTAKSGKHKRPGWVNIECPFCYGNPGYHGGFHIGRGYYNCHRCGWHWLPKVISTLTGLSVGKAYNVIKQFATGEVFEEYQIERPSSLIFPSEFKTVGKQHFQYLKNRNFPPSTARTWGLLGTGVYGEYSHRIIAPIYLDGQLISYQGRDITGKSSLRYKACPKHEEVYDHQHTLYGIDKVQSDKVLIVEGITDVWRIGPGACATFGIEWTTAQGRLIASKFKRFSILYDNDPQAIDKAEELYQYLTGFGLKGDILTLDDKYQDPGSMPNNKVEELRKQVGI